MGPMNSSIIPAVRRWEFPSFQRSPFVSPSGGNVSGSGDDRRLTRNDDSAMTAFPPLRQVAEHLESLFELGGGELRVMLDAITPILKVIKSEEVVSPNMYRLLVEQNLVDTLLRKSEEELSQIVDAVHVFGDAVLGQKLGLRSIRKPDPEEVISYVEKIRSHFHIKLGSVFVQFDEGIKMVSDAIWELMYIIENITMVQDRLLEAQVPFKLSEATILKLLHLTEATRSEVSNLAHDKVEGVRTLLGDIMEIQRPILSSPKVKYEPLVMAADRIAIIAEAAGILEKIPNQFIDIMNRDQYDFLMALGIMADQVISGTVDSGMSALKIIDVFGSEAFTTIQSLTANGLNFASLGTSEEMRDAIAELGKERRWTAPAIGEAFIHMDGFISRIKEIQGVFNRFLEVFNLPEDAIDVRDWLCEGTEICGVYRQVANRKGSKEY